MGLSHFWLFNLSVGLCVSLRVSCYMHTCEYDDQYRIEGNEPKLLKWLPLGSRMHLFFFFATFIFQILPSDYVLLL